MRAGSGSGVRRPFTGERTRALTKRVARGGSRRRLLLGCLWIATAAAQWWALQPTLARGDPHASVLLYHVVGASFAACGLLAWTRQPTSLIGRLMAVTGYLFYARLLLNRLDSSFVQTFAIVFGNMWLISFGALLIAFPGGRRWTRRRAWSMVGVAVLLETGLTAASLMLIPAPGNLLFISANAAAEAEIIKATGIIRFVAALAIVAVLVLRWRGATAPARRASAPAAAGGLTLLFLAGLLLQGAFTDAQSPFLVWPTLVGLLFVPIMFLVGVWRTWIARAAIGELLVDLGSMNGRSLQSVLGKALRDPTLTLAYWLPEFGSYADSEGRPVELPTTDATRLVATLEQDEQRVAAIVYDASLAGERKLLDAVIAAAGIALENERLAAELRARVSELKASRARIVDAGDEARRRLERNLHDGAQQRLVALGMQLRLLESRIRTDPATAEALVATAASELSISVEELRELARGIHPAVLDHGLTVALESLAARSTISTAVSVELLERLPAAVEVAAYFIASEALANVAKYARATSVAITVSRNANGALVEVSDDGVGGANDAGGSGLRGLADRVEALGGHLRINSPLGAGTTISAVIPCAS
jgi:signal transduction histidine kinase